MSGERGSGRSVLPARHDDDKHKFTNDVNFINTLVNLELNNPRRVEIPQNGHLKSNQNIYIYIYTLPHEQDATQCQFLSGL